MRRRSFSEKDAVIHAVCKRDAKRRANAFDDQTTRASLLVRHLPRRGGELMKRLISVLAVTFVLAALVVTSAVAGGSNGKGGQTIKATCSVLGPVTVHVSSGQSAWVDNTHYVTVWLTGTFTPTGGQPTTFTKSYGNKSGFGT